MNRVGAGIAVLMAVALAAPVAATTSAQFTKVGLTSANIGTSFTLAFQGVSDGAGTTAQFTNISGTTTYNLVSVLHSGSGNSTTSTWRFIATLTNTSLAPMTSARISTFGFSTAAGSAATSNNNNPTFLPLSAAVVGTPLFESVLVNNSGGLNVPNVSGSNSPQLCFKDGGNNNNCNGGAGGGLGMIANSTNAGTQANPFPSTSTEFTLAFTGSSQITSLTLHNFYLRFQSLSGTGTKVGGGTGFFNDGSGVAIVVPDDIDPVPEPASWAMLIAGFGLTGAAMRRRRAVAA